MIFLNLWRLCMFVGCVRETHPRGAMYRFLSVHSRVRGDQTIDFAVYLKRDDRPFFSARAYPRWHFRLAGWCR